MESRSLPSWPGSSALKTRVNALSSRRSIAREHFAQPMDMRVKRAYDIRNTLRNTPHAMTLISEPVRAELVSAYTAADRHYHDLRHIEALLGLAHACASAITDGAAVEAAIWFHDAVYDTRRSDNEERSAALAMARLAASTDEGPIARIPAMIRATAGHPIPDFTRAAAARA